MKFGLAGLLLACSLSGCASLKNSTVDVMYINVHSHEVKQVEEPSPYFGVNNCLKWENVPRSLDRDVAVDLNVFYDQNECPLDFTYYFYKQDVKLQVLKVSY